MPVPAALITSTEADTFAPLYLTTAKSDAWIALTQVDKDRHILQASRYLLTNLTCVGAWDEAAPPDEIKHAVALLAFLNVDQDLFYAASTTGAGLVVEETDKAAVLTTTRKYASGTSTTQGNRLDPVRALLRRVTFTNGDIGACSLGATSNFVTRV